MQRWYKNKRLYRRDHPEDASSSSPLRKQVSMSHSPNKRGRLPVVLGLVALGVLLGAGLLTLAGAQSGRSALSLNSPASFPVDI